MLDRLANSPLRPDEALAMAMWLLPVIRAAVAEAYDCGYRDGARDALRTA
jgi:hypothetical protein